LQLFVDMDGVLADFDAHHAAVFGIRSSKLTDDVDWEKVRGITGFYSEMPPMVDMHVLWEYISKYKPILLSGSLPWSKRLQRTSGIGRASIWDQMSK
jgi:5'-nucleotidase